MFFAQLLFCDRQVLMEDSLSSPHPQSFDKNLGSKSLRKKKAKDRSPLKRCLINGEAGALAMEKNIPFSCLVTSRPS